MCRYLMTNDLVYDRMKQFVQHNMPPIEVSWLGQTKKCYRLEYQICLCDLFQNVPVLMDNSISWYLELDQVVPHVKLSNWNQGQQSVKSGPDCWRISAEESKSLLSLQYLRKITKIIQKGLNFDESVNELLNCFYLILFYVEPSVGFISDLP